MEISIIIIVMIFFIFYSLWILVIFDTSYIGGRVDPSKKFWKENNSNFHMLPKNMNFPPRDGFSQITSHTSIYLLFYKHFSHWHIDTVIAHEAFKRSIDLKYRNRAKVIKINQVENTFVKHFLSQWFGSGAIREGRFLLFQLLLLLLPYPTLLTSPPLLVSPSSSSAYFYSHSYYY